MIELEQVSKSFGQNQVIHPMSYCFEPGKSYAIIGKSGSGKSTLLNMLARLEKPTSGRILYKGRDLYKSIREQVFFRQELGYIFQNYALIDDESVWQNLKRLGKKADIIQQLEKVGLGERFLRSKIYELSGGQAQRVAIARLLLKAPPLILADEPTASLDDETGRVIIELLMQQQTHQNTLIFSTHDPNIYTQVDECLALSDLGEQLR